MGFLVSSFSSCTTFLLCTTFWGGTNYGHVPMSFSSPMCEMLQVFDLFLDRVIFSQNGFDEVVG